MLLTTRPRLTEERSSKITRLRKRYKLLRLTRTSNHGTGEKSKYLQLNPIQLAVFLARQALGRRPNFKTMSLMARSFEVVGIYGKTEKPQVEGEPYEHFRELFFRGDDIDRNSRECSAMY
jgi:hypothetical protein